MFPRPSQYYFILYAYTLVRDRDDGVQRSYETIQYDSLLDVNYYFIRQQREPGAGGRGDVLIEG